MYRYVVILFMKKKKDDLHGNPFGTTFFSAIIKIVFNIASLILPIHFVMKSKFVQMLLATKISVFYGTKVFEFSRGASMQ